MPCRLFEEVGVLFKSQRNTCLSKAVSFIPVPSLVDNECIHWSFRGLLTLHRARFGVLFEKYHLGGWRLLDVVPINL